MWVVVQGSACSKAHARVGVIVCRWLQGSACSKASGSAASIVHRSELTGGGVDSSSRAPSCVDGRSSVRMWSAAAVDKATETEDQDDTDNDDDVPLSALLHSSCRPQHDPAQVYTSSCRLRFSYNTVWSGSQRNELLLAYSCLTNHSEAHL